MAEKVSQNKVEDQEATRPKFTFAMEKIEFDFLKKASCKMIIYNDSISIIEEMPLCTRVSYIYPQPMRHSLCASKPIVINLPVIDKQQGPSDKR